MFSFIKKLFGFEKPTVVTEVAPYKVESQVVLTPTPVIEVSAPVAAKKPRKPRKPRAPKVQS